MSTNKTSTTTNQYDPSSMNRYQGAQNTLFNTYSSMVSNPYSGQNYQMGLQQNQNASNQLASNSVSNAMSNFNMSGMGNLTGGARASLLSGLSRSASGMRQQGFFNNWNTATANQQFGAGVLGSMQPLQTGQTNVQKTSGLGSWLPQVAAAGIGAASTVATGGAAAPAAANQLTGTSGAFGSYFGNMSAPTGGTSTSSPFTLPSFGMNGPTTSQPWAIQS